MTSQTNEQMTNPEAIIADLTEKLRVAREALEKLQYSDYETAVQWPTRHVRDAALSTIDAPSVSQPPTP